MITWTQSGTTKSINNNNIVYAKQGADGEPVLIDRIIAVDTSTNPPTESVVYQSNSILRALASGQSEGPSLTGGQAWYRTRKSDDSGWSLNDYYWITYATQYGTKSSIGTTYGILDTYGTKNAGSDSWTSGPVIRAVPSAVANRFHYNMPVNIQYTYATPYRVVVKCRASDTAIQLRVTGDNGWSTLGYGGRFNGSTTEQILYDGLMDNVTRDYNFNCDLSLRNYSARFTHGNYVSSGTYFPTQNWTEHADMQGWFQERTRGNLIYVPASITRTIEIYDPNTGDLIASNTSALSSTWTARH